jgi:pimeloyl-ACP methyl ester carboxylesterase
MSVIHVRSKDGTKIAVDQVGVGRPIVIVHGATVDRAVWAKVATLLADRFSVFSFDRLTVRSPCSDIRQAGSLRCRRSSS